MQNKKFKIKAPTKKTLICVNSLLCALSLTLILMLSCHNIPAIQYKYTVQSGDTLEIVAAISGLNPVEIHHYNKLEKKLQSGQVLYLPGVAKLKCGNKLQQLKIITRKEWLANKAGSMKDASVYKKITIHHTTDNPKYPKKSSASFVKGIQEYHQKKKKWADIGYHYLISKEGTIFEGRLLSNLGAHVKGHNSGNIGIALLGDFDRDKLNKQQKDTLRLLTEALQERYNIPKQQIYRHKDLGDTKCPGKHCADFVKSLK